MIILRRRHTGLGFYRIRETPEATRDGLQIHFFFFLSRFTRWLPGWNLEGVVIYCIARKVSISEAVIFVLPDVASRSS